MLIAYVLRPYKESVVLYYGKNEVELSADIICSIIDVNGIDYQILLESGTQKKDESIAELLDVFAQYADTQSKSINKIYNVVKLMQNWMRSLPEYTKRCESICENGLFIQLSLEELNFKKELLKFEINAREFLDIMAENKIVPSKAEGRRLIQQGGLSLNGEKVTDVTRTLNEEDIQDGAALIKRGKKNYNKIVVE